MITGPSGSVTSDPGPPMMDPQHRRAHRAAPNRTEPHRAYPAAPDRTEHCRVCRTGRKGRPPCMPHQAERKYAAYATSSRMDERHMCRAGQNGGPPCTLCCVRQNGTPIPHRVERITAAQTGPCQTERNTAAHTGPCQIGRKTSAYTAPGGTEDRCACRPGRKGRTLRMPRRAERKTTAHTAGRTGQDGRPPRMPYRAEQKTAAHIKGRTGQDGRPPRMRAVCRAYRRPRRAGRKMTTTMPHWA